MESFYMIVVLIAVVILVLCLTGIGILMRYQNAGQQYPPSANTCPDGWNNTSGTSCTSPGTSCTSPVLPANTHYGVDGTNGYTFSTQANTTGDTIDFSNAYWNDVCKKKKWANKYGINWDGVSNYTKC